LSNGACSKCMLRVNRDKSHYSSEKLRPALLHFYVTNAHCCYKNIPDDRNRYNNQSLRGYSFTKGLTGFPLTFFHFNFHKNIFFMSIYNLQFTLKATKLETNIFKIFVSLNFRFL